ncbi:MAG TPA: hypothetical protein VNZ43_10375 [Sphingomonadaceae bacterium]|nr:hypothetical protein [Sphingomonadaceae bacterium]
MKLPLLLASAAMMAAPSMPSPAPPAAVRLPGFAAALAQSAPIASPAAWTIIPEAEAWAALTHASGIDRQQARWARARSLIGRGRGADALGVLDVMAGDDPDLAIVDAWRLAHGAALTLMSHFRDAANELAGAGLTANAEACAWRLRASAEAGEAKAALAAFPCAQPAIVARPIEARKPFILALARAAVEDGKPDLALRWLGALADRDSAANLLRGRAYGLLGRRQEARLRLARVERSGTAPERMDARLSLIEAGVANDWLSRRDALRQLEALRYVWRGGAIEERALRLAYRLATQGDNLDETLRIGATLFRFFDPVRQGPDFLPGLQARLAAALEPESKVPLIHAAGLFWDYRDLLPGGAEGDLMVSKLGARLQAAGLYERAAELFEHQLLVRASDLAQGPLSAKVATLYILAGRPDRAIVAMRKTAKVDYPDAMLFARKRVEAVALSQLNRVPEAFAVLQGVPDAAAIRAEIAWKKHDWAKVAAETEGQLPGAGHLTDVDQAIVLRRAIALAMLGREEALSALHARYAPSFAPLPNGAAFAMLTAKPGSIDPTAIAKAMASLPAASPAGELGDLIEAGK